MASVIALRPAVTDPAQPPSRADALAQALLADAQVAPHAMIEALRLHRARGGRFADLLLARGLVAEDALFRAMAQVWQVALLDTASLRPDARLIDAFGAVDCMALHVLPCRVVGGGTLVATAYPEDFHRHRPRLEALFGPVLMVLAPRAVIEAALLGARGAGLARLAETRVALPDSCRSYRADAYRLPAALLALLLTLAAVSWPAQASLAVTLLALLSGMAFTGLKMAALVGALRHRAEPPAPLIARLPIVSVMVALYREANIAPRLVKRLGKLDYPQELLDVLLVVEADDQLTRAALDRAELPGWMRVVVVPDGTVKTKPRALNFALDHCRGSIVGVYDAEDAPEPDQIRRVVDRFHSRGPDLACLQGRLDFYNPRVNWFSRCFTIEYAAWFRLLLPGIERLGLAVPLGGTTLFFRRAVLESLGRWDAHNVTEDADLGMRIARRGYRTELLDTTTYEEANCRPRSWVKQRSRWIKGFMMTWLTHMRDPRLLWRELGPRKFLGFQLLLAGSVLHALLAPVLWSFWLLPFGLPHPVVAILPDAAFTALLSGFLLIEASLIAFGIAGLARTGHRLSPLWVPTMVFYYPLATLAAYKAAWEMLVQPFYWDKTAHGEFDQMG
ncbi:glycosyltransferase family 2 protein [Tabrizicola oligotrophica]|uniref:Glycosyltransferase n=1 Tax=Tabrizicola oligotrophica TaxID=2710650 RepID=A0A6M0QWU9_9RHOB|nr:glycosyltransferase family 2 protein [Tabrizicola oligotrophica]NEY91935.1 glycosyltransferase [Tabrizicola oligotrophica]